MSARLAEQLPPPTGLLLAGDRNTDTSVLGFLPDEVLLEIAKSVRPDCKTFKTYEAREAEYQTTRGRVSPEEMIAYLESNPYILSRRRAGTHSIVMEIIRHLATGNLPSRVNDIIGKRTLEDLVRLIKSSQELRAELREDEIVEISCQMGMAGSPPRYMMYAISGEEDMREMRVMMRRGTWRQETAADWRGTGKTYTTLWSKLRSGRWEWPGHDEWAELNEWSGLPEWTCMDGEMGISRAWLRPYGMSTETGFTEVGIDTPYEAHNDWSGWTASRRWARMCQEVFFSQSRFALRQSSNLQQWISTTPCQYLALVRMIVLDCRKDKTSKARVALNLVRSKLPGLQRLRLYLPFSFTRKTRIPPRLSQGLEGLACVVELTLVMNDYHTSDEVKAWVRGLRGKKIKLCGELNGPFF